jgi:hypothetical protein
MTQVIFQAAGAGSGTTGNPTPGYPFGLQSGDLIVLQVTVRDLTNTPTTPIGFTLLYGPDVTTLGRQWIYSKISDGTETGTITVTIGGTVCKMARMYSFRNNKSSGFTEGGGFGSGTDSSIEAQSVITIGGQRLAVSFVFVNDDNAVGPFTGETGGDWVEAAAEFTTTAGSDGCIQLQIATMASAGMISGGVYTMTAADPWGVRAFAIIPAEVTPVDKSTSDLGSGSEILIKERETSTSDLGGSMDVVLLERDRNIGDIGSGYEGVSLLQVISKYTSDVGEGLENLLKDRQIVILESGYGSENITKEVIGETKKRREWPWIYRGP